LQTILELTSALSGTEIQRNLGRLIPDLLRLSALSPRNALKLLKLNPFSKPLNKNATLDG
jgi:hypothetical protein